MKTLYWTDNPTGARIKGEEQLRGAPVFTFVTPADSHVCDIASAQRRKLWELLEWHEAAPEAGEKLKAAEERIEELESQLTNSEQESEDFETKWDEVTDELEEANEKIKGLDLRVEELTKERDLQRQALIDQANRNAELAADRSRLIRSVEGLEEELGNARRENSELLEGRKSDL